jgi:hypothetical protein
VRISGYYVRIYGDNQGSDGKVPNWQGGDGSGRAAAKPLSLCVGRVKKQLGRRGTIVAKPLTAGGGRTVLAVWAVVIVAVQAIFGSAATVMPRSQVSADYRLSATALFMGGTGQPLVVPPDTPDFISDYIRETYEKFVAPTGLCLGGDPGCRQLAVYTPEQLAPLQGELPFSESVAVGRQLIDNCIRGSACIATQSPYTSTGPTSLTDTHYVVFGESQSAVISSYEKSYLIAHPPTDTSVNFVLLSNQNRPNGGVLERFVGAYLPILDIAFNGATPTNSPQPTPLTTADFVSQYDGWADFPNNPLNLLAVLNALMGMAFLHHECRCFEGAPELQGYYQDTTYYMLPTGLVPLLVPLSRIPLVGLPLAVALDAPMRVLVETGYDRTINPGQPTPANYAYFPNPITTLRNFAVAIPTGWDDAIAYLSGNPANRPFHTEPPPVFGVGGPPLYAGAIDPYGQVDPPTASPPVASQTLAPASTAVPVKRRSSIAAINSRRASSQQETAQAVSQDSSPRAETHKASPGRANARVRVGKAT